MTKRQTVLKEIVGMVANAPGICIERLYADYITKNDKVISYNRFRKTITELSQRGEIHYHGSKLKGTGGWYLGANQPSSRNADATGNKPKAAEDTDHDPKISHPRPGVMRVKMHHVRVGEKPSKMQHAGIRSGFSLIDAL